MNVKSVTYVYNMVKPKLRFTNRITAQTVVKHLNRVAMDLCLGHIWTLTEAEANGNPDGKFIVERRT